jgi:hypothetical protein
MCCIFLVAIYTFIYGKGIKKFNAVVQVSNF